ncbi:hypothetical protein [Actinophytocola sp.]|uniref:hypothetical protein n=1 Tax=Actinophytocola sp. TaxID=1872138 RepID=UPI002D80C1BD|nr:hypothetical protein [Actinophytocola sp.]HET9138762.1 hypothetical protein [Actinophytocola sp.]
MTTSIVQLWEDGATPAWDGIYWANGSARSVELVGEARLERLALGPPLDLEAMLSNDPDNLTHVDVVHGADVPIPDGSGYVCGGEGSHGSAGFFARLDRDRNLMWIVSLSCSNPFEAADVRDSHATFTNNLGYSLTIDLDDPDFS